MEAPWSHGVGSHVMKAEIAPILTKSRRRIAAASTMYLVGIPTTEQYLTGAMRRQKQQKLMATDHLNDSF